VFEERLKEAALRIQRHFDSVFAEFEDVPVTQAMAYATYGGKRLRGFLAVETARLHGVDIKRAIWPATAAEALHAYSLVHDDLPCMDDDDLRRGLPTVHIKWDEATAVLVGDGLQTLAFDLVLRPEVGTEVVRADLGRSLARASGATGMVLGQALDMAAESARTTLSLEEISYLQENKTGALIRWSAEAGARIAGDDPSAFGAYAKALGLAFQIADDILDIEGDVRTVGKAVGKDSDAGKATFVAILGLDEAKRRARNLADEACDCIAIYGDEAESLREIAHYVITRNA